MSYEGLSIGHYHLLHIVGKGGMSDVYLADDTKLPRQVAIKILHAEVTSYPTIQSTQEVIRLFKREVDVIASLHHPSILPIIEADKTTFGDTTLMYMVMPFHSDGSLEGWLQQHNGSLSLHLVEDIIRQAAEALDYAHEHHVIHQDIKPSNFLIWNPRENSDRLDLLLADFGIAKLISTATDVSTTIRGTYTYMAPEQWEGQAVPATDQYSLAIMAYQLLVGKPPFQGNQYQIMYKHLNEQPEHIYQHDPRLSKETDAVLQRALAKKPEQRYPTVSAFADTLSQSLHAMEHTIPVVPSLEKTLPVAQQSVPATPIVVGSGSSSSSNLDTQLNTAPEEAIDAKSTKHIREITGSTATIWLTGSLIAVLVFIVGVIFYALGLLPSSLITVATIVWSVITVLGVSLGGAISKSLFPEGNINQIWEKANWRRALMVSSLLVCVIFAGPTLAFSSTRLCSSLNTCSAAEANAILQANTTATATSDASIGTSPQNVYSSSMKNLVLDDPLNSSKNYNWEKRSDKTPVGQAGNCDMADSYLVNQYKPRGYTTCALGGFTFSDFTFQAQMKIFEGDTAGIIFRANGINQGNFYYLAVNSNGFYVFDISQDYYYQKTLAQDTLPANIFNTGRQQRNLLAVVAVGNQFDLYMNRHFLRRVVDPGNTYSQGTIGFIADEGKNTTKASFNNAKVWTVDTPSALGSTATVNTTLGGTPTAIAVKNPDPYPPGNGMFGFYNSLHQADQWNDVPLNATGGSCSFSGDGYHVLEANIKHFNYCVSTNSFENFTFEVRMKIIQGACGGVVFRADATAGSSYFFQVCQNGTYALYKVGIDNSTSPLISSKSSSVISKGLNQVNTVAVTAEDNQLTLYVNNTDIDTITDKTCTLTDKTCTFGQFGLVAYSDNRTTEVVYSEARVWQL